MSLKKLILVLMMLMMGAALVWPSPTQAQRPDAPRYAQRGPFAVGTQELRLEDDTRPLELTVWYPTVGEDVPYTYRYSLIQLEGQAVLDGEVLTGDTRYPLIVFSHGSSGYRLQSLYLTEHLASYGFVVVAADHVGNTVLDEMNLDNLTLNFAQRPLDVLRVVEFMADNNDMVFGGMIDIDTIAVVGHSFGGFTALSSGGALVNSESLGQAARFVGSDSEIISQIANQRGLRTVPDGLWPSTAVPNLQAVVGLAPAFAVAFGEAGLASIDIPTMLLVGSADQLTPLETEAAVVYSAINSTDRYLGVFANADHYIFANACTPIVIQAGFFQACSDPVWDMARAHDLINHFTTAFLLAYLQNDTDARVALDPDKVDVVGFDYQSMHIES